MSGRKLKHLTINRVIYLLTDGKFKNELEYYLKILVFYSISPKYNRIITPSQPLNNKLGQNPLSTPKY